jgi:UDP-galactopyranose mutase
VRNGESLALYERYRSLAEQEANKTFIGRCGLFRYIDMVPCVTIHLQLVSRFLAGAPLTQAA